MWALLRVGRGVKGKVKGGCFLYRLYAGYTQALCRLSGSLFYLYSGFYVGFTQAVISGMLLLCTLYLGATYATQAAVL